MQEINLNSIPFGDSIYVIYYLSKEKILNPKVHHIVFPLINEKREYYRMTFKEIYAEIESKEKNTISHCMVIAEFGLQGTIYRYNNYSDGQIYECGSTRGYA